MIVMSVTFPKPTFSTGVQQNPFNTAEYLILHIVPYERKRQAR